MLPFLSMGSFNDLGVSTVFKWPNRYLFCLSNNIFKHCLLTFLLNELLDTGFG